MSTWEAAPAPAAAATACALHRALYATPCLACLQPHMRIICLCAHAASAAWPGPAWPGLQGAIPMGEDDWNAARILDGRPAAGAELTEDYNPLEAGLYDMVSLNKGCYIGQVGQAGPHGHTVTGTCPTCRGRQGGSSLPCRIIMRPACREGGREGWAQSQPCLQPPTHIHAFSLLSGRWGHHPCRLERPPSDWSACQARYACVHAWCMPPWLPTPDWPALPWLAVQETLAKLALTDGVRQQLWGLQFPGPVQPGAPIYSEMSKVRAWRGLEAGLEGNGGGGGGGRWGPMKRKEGRGLQGPLPCARRCA